MKVWGSLKVRLLNLGFLPFCWQVTLSWSFQILIFYTLSRHNCFLKSFGVFSFSVDNTNKYCFSWISVIYISKSNVFFKNWESVEWFIFCLMVIYSSMHLSMIFNNLWKGKMNRRLLRKAFCWFCVSYFKYRFRNKVGPV